MLSQHGYRQRQRLKRTIPPNPNFNKRVFPLYGKRKFHSDVGANMTKSVRPQNKPGPSKVFNGSKNGKSK